MIQAISSCPQSPDFVSIYPTPFKTVFSAISQKGILCVCVFLPMLNDVAVLDFLLARLKPQMLYSVLVQDLAQESVCVHYGRGSNDPI